MFRIDDQGTPLCDGITRREWLRVGGLGMLGLTLPNLLASRQAAAAGETRTGRAKSCIVLCFLGCAALVLSPAPSASATSDRCAALVASLRELG